MAQAVFVEVRNVRNPRHLSSIVTGIDKKGQKVQDAILTVYNGFLELDIDESDNDLKRFDVITYVLMNNDDPNDYLVDDKLIVDYSEKQNILIDAVATATVCTFASAPETCGVDFLIVELEEHLFKDAVKRTVLVLTVRVALQDGKIHGIAYQVTTLSKFPRQVLITHKPNGRDRPGLTI
jgi:hypothetical protein